MKKISLNDLIFFFIMFIFFTVASSAVLNSNLMVHIKAGEWMLNNKAILDHDVFSYTFNGEEWININWLFQIVSALIYKYLGLHGFSLLTGFIFAFSFSLVLNNVIKKTQNVLVVLIMFIFAIVVSTFQWTAIPSTMNIIFVTIICISIQDIFKNKIYPYFVIPIIIMLWANINYDFTIGLVLLLIYIIGILFEIIVFKLKENISYLKKIGIILFLSVLISFINPFSYKIYTKVFTLFITSISEKTNELNTIDFSENGKLALIYFIFVLLILIFSFNRVNNKKIDFKFFLIFCYWQFNFLYSQIYLTIYLLVSILFISEIIPALSIENTKIKFLEKISIKLTQKTLQNKRIFKINSWFIIFIMIGFLILNNRFDSFVNTEFPTELFEGANYLKKQNITGNGFHSDLHGNLIIWNNSPNLKVMIDSRPDFYHTKFTSNYSKAFLMNPGWEKVFENKTFDYVILKRNTALVGVLKLMDNWVKVYETSYETILLRKDYYEEIKDNITIEIEK